MSFPDDHFREHLVYSTRAPAGTVLGHLQHIRESDARAEAEHRRLASWASTTMVGGWLLSALMCFSGDEALIIAAVCLAVLTAAVAFALFRAAQKHKRLDVENRRYQLLDRVLRLLHTDMHPSEEVALSLDLRPAQHASKQRGTRTRDIWTLVDFLDPWLSLETRLLDGTHLHLELLDKVQKRTGYKHNGRKSKFKSKTKRATLAVLRLRVPPQRYPGLAGLGKRGRWAVQLPQGVTVSRFGVQRDRLLLKVDLGPEWETGRAEPPGVDGSRVVGMMLMSLYQVLNRSRTQARVRQARP